MPKFTFNDYTISIAHILKLEGIKLCKLDENLFLSGNKDIFFSELEIDFDSMMQVEICAYLEARYGSDYNIVDAILKSSSFYNLFRNLVGNNSNIVPKNAQNTALDSQIVKPLWGFNLQTIKSYKNWTDLKKALFQIEKLLTPCQINSLFESNKREIEFLRQSPRSFATNLSITITSAKTNSVDGYISCKPTPKENFSCNYNLLPNTVEFKVNYILEWLSYNKQLIDCSRFRNNNQFKIVENHQDYMTLSADAFQQKATKTLLFLFTGRGGRLMSPLPWVLSNINPQRYDIILFKYPLKNDGYQLGLPSITNGLRGFAKFIIKASFNYDKTSFLGVSGGGLPAILFSTFLPNAPCISAAGKNINDPRWQNKLNLFDLSKINSKKVLCLFGREAFKDKLNAIELKKNFPKINAYEIRKESGAVHHHCFTNIIMSQGVNKLLKTLENEKL